MINKEQLKQYLNSKRCLPKYKQYSVDQLFPTLDTDKSLRAQVNFFLITNAKASKRNTKTNNVSTVQNTVIQPQFITVSNIEPQSVSIFEDYIDETDLSDLERQIRNQFLNDIDLARQTGGCSQCKRNTLIRKYSKKLEELTSDT